MCKCRIGRSSDVFLQKFSYLINQLWRLWCVAREQSVWIIAQAAERRARRVRHPQVGRPPPEHRAEPLPGQVQATQALRGTASSRCFVLGCSCCLICWYFDNGWRSFMSMMSKLLIGYVMIWVHSEWANGVLLTAEGLCGTAGQGRQATVAGEYTNC